MRIEATAKQIRLLLRLVERDEGGSHERVQRGLPGPVFDRYLSLRDAGRHPPVVAIERGACSGCHVRLPTMLEQRAGRAPALYTCPQCRRMLYSPEVLRAELPPAEEKPSHPETPESAGRRS